MSRRARTIVFLVGAAGLAPLLAWGFAGLPDFGHYPGPYGTLLNRVALGETHATNVVATVVFDYRGFDTLGEELILFTAVIGVALLLREAREEEARPVGDPIAHDPIRVTGLALVPIGVLLGLFVVAFGYLTPGGGFQGGVVVALAIVLVYLAADHTSFSRLTPKPLLDLLEGAGAGAFVALGVGALAGGLAFLESFLPRGTIGTLTSAGSVPLLNWATGVEVAAAFVLLFSEFLEELMVERRRRSA